MNIESRSTTAYTSTEELVLSQLLMFRKIEAGGVQQGGKLWSCPAIQQNAATANANGLYAYLNLSNRLDLVKVVPVAVAQVTCV